jgi:membrane-bound ClpP family serine protease
VEIDDNDKNAFMTVIHNLDRKKGLDLFLHTPGGQVAATESLVDYIRRMFGTDVEIFIPQLAMSAGTMVACAGSKIHMGKQSNLGPIDPQFGGIPASEVLEEFNRAAKEIKNDSSKIPLWQVIIGKYHPTFIGECEHAVKWSKDIVRQWLITGMLSGDKNSIKKANNIVKHLSDHSKHKSHARHINIDECKEIGLKISNLESDPTLQDLVLTVHHTYIHTLTGSLAYKIVENHDEKAMLLMARMAPVVPQNPTN